MVDDEVSSKARVKRIPTSQRALLTEEHSDRIKSLAFGRQVARIVFVTLIVIIGLHGVEDARFRVAMTVASCIFGSFWYLDELRQRNQLSRVIKVLQIFEEKSSPRYSQDAIIRLEYNLRNGFIEIVGRLLRIEPVVWMVGVIASIWGKMSPLP
jgi:hypothetical protein